MKSGIQSWLSSEIIFLKLISNRQFLAQGLTKDVITFLAAKKLAGIN